jgi:DNA damage-inducible protein 1
VDTTASTAAVSHPTPAPSPAPSPAPVAASDAIHAGAAKTIRLTVSDIEGDVRVIEVDENETVENVKAVLEVEFAVPLKQQLLFFETKQLENNQRLNAAGVKNDDMIMMQAVRAAPARPTSAMPRQGAGASPAGGLNLMGMLGGMGGGMASARNPLDAHMNEANQLLHSAGSDPHFVRRIQENHKELADALASGKPEEVAKQVMEIHRIKKETEFKKMQAIMRLNADPFDVEAQKQIEEMVRMENVNANLDQVELGNVSPRLPFFGTSYKAACLHAYPKKQLVC